MRNISCRSRLMARGPVFRERSLQIHHTHGYVSIKNLMMEEQITVFNFDVLLTVLLSIILVTNQLHAQNLVL